MDGTLTKKGKYWYVVVDLGKDENGKRQQKWHNTKCENKAEAQIVKREILSSIDKGTYVKPQKKTFVSFMYEWLEVDVKTKRATTTYEGYKVVIDKHIAPYFKDTQLQKLQTIDLQKYYNFLLSTGLSPNTIKHHHANIHKCLKYALRMGVIQRNVADAVELPKVEKFKANFYNGKQIEQLLKAVEGSYIEVPVTITIAMGLRRGEVLALRWDDIYLETKEMKIHRNRVRMMSSIHEKAPKTESSNRTLIIPDYLLKYLKQLNLKQEQNKKWVFGNSYYDEGYVCCKADGTPIGVDYVSQYMKKLLEDHNMPHIRFHDLRHPYVKTTPKNNLILFCLYILRIYGLNLSMSFKNRAQ